MARQYLGLLWEGLMVGLRLGLPRCPGPPRPSGEQPRRRRRLCSSIPMLQRAIWTAVNRTTSGFFYPIEEAELGPVAGKRVLHLQCHFGSDTLKLAQRGANAIGLDFSADAIAAARRLAGELGLADRTDFVLADLYNAPAAIAEPAGFDIVFVSWGAICWLPDIHRWAEIVAHFLRPGGFLYIAEAHPTAMVFHDAAILPDGRPIWRTRRWSWSRPTTTLMPPRRSITRPPIPGSTRWAISSPVCCKQA